jgi:hypothetical protein
LHQNLRVESLTGPNIQDFAFGAVDLSLYPFTPEARILNVRLKKPLVTGGQLHIEMAYSGQIGIVGDWETNRITEEWVELGLYAPWFPYHPDLSGIGFDITLKIDDAYQVVSNGHTVKQAGYWRIHASHSDNDIVITAAKNIQTSERRDNKLSFGVHWTTTLGDAALDDLLTQGINIMQRYNKWFGEIESASGFILISPREKGGGYARKNLIVLTAIEDKDYFENKKAYIRYFAHELGHKWWSRARSDSWEDWLNESFAEYSALMVVRDLLGEEEFENRMNKKKERMLSLPPIRGLARKDQDAYKVLYDKGPVLLQNLEGRVGREVFAQLLKSMSLAEVSSTKQFLALLKKETGLDEMEYFSALLDQ